MEFFIGWTQLLYEIVFIWGEYILQVWCNTTRLFSGNVRSDPNYLNAVYGMLSLTVMVLQEGRCIIHVKMMNQWELCQELTYEKNTFFQRKGDTSVYWAVSQKCERSWIWKKLVTCRKMVPGYKDVNLGGSTLGFPDCFKWGIQDVWCTNLPL